tara:strand:+ start:2305 stop:2553 length:249 start_codon:yes stop_codon:yes gene_type:complete
MYPSLKSLCDEYEVKEYWKRDKATFGFYTKLGWEKQWHWYEYDKPEQRMMQVGTTLEEPKIKKTKYRKVDDPYYKHKDRSKE